MRHSVDLHVNGRAVTVSADDPGPPLLYALRNELDLQSPRFGCGIGQCGACTVHIDGEAIRSCIVPLSALSASQKIVTLEGLGSQDHPHPVRQAFLGEQAMQCGYCINGMIMESAALLAKVPNPSLPEIRQAIAHNVCRCDSYSRIARVVHRAVARQSSSWPDT